MTDINRFLADISSLYWWVAVVVVGLAINLASAYLKPVLERHYSAYSDRSKRRSESEQKQIEVEAGILHKSTRLLVLKGFEEIRWFVLSIFLLVFAFGLAALAAYLVASTKAGLFPFYAGLMFVFAFATIVFSFWAFRKAADASLVLLATRIMEFDELLQIGEASSSANGPAKIPGNAA